MGSDLGFREPHFTLYTPTRLGKVLVPSNREDMVPNDGYFRVY